MSGELHTDVEPEEVPPSSPWLGRERLAGLSLIGLDCWRSGRARTCPSPPSSA